MAGVDRCHYLAVTKTRWRGAGPGSPVRSSCVPDVHKDREDAPVIIGGGQQAQLGEDGPDVGLYCRR